MTRRRFSGRNGSQTTLPPRLGGEKGYTVPFSPLGKLGGNLSISLESEKFRRRWEKEFKKKRTTLALQKKEGGNIYNKP